MSKVNSFVNRLNRLLDRSVESIDPDFTALLAADDMTLLKNSCRTIFSGGKSLLHLVIQSFNYNAYKCILKPNEINIYARDQYGRTPFMYCCLVSPESRKQSAILLRIFEDLLEISLKQNMMTIKDNYSLDVFHICLLKRRLFFAGLLIQAGIPLSNTQIQIGNRVGPSLFHYIAHISTKGPRSQIDMNFSPQNTLSSLVEVIVVHCLRNKISLDKLYRDESVIYTTCYSRNLVLFQYLFGLKQLEDGVYWNIRELVGLGWSPVFGCLFQNGTIEHEVDQESDAWFCEHLLQNGARIDRGISMSRDRPPLQLALHRRNIHRIPPTSHELVMLLVNYGADLTHTTFTRQNNWRYTQSMLRSSLEAGEPEITRRILEAKDLKEWRTIDDKQNGYYLRRVVHTFSSDAYELCDFNWAMRNLEVIKILLEKGESIEYMRSDNVRLASIISNLLFFHLKEDIRPQYLVMKAIKVLFDSKKALVNYTRGDSMNFLMLTLQRNNYGLTRLVAFNDIDLDYKYLIAPCSRQFCDNGPHRFTCYPNLVDYYALSNDIPENHNMHCDICLSRIEVQRTQIKLCQEIRCDTVACESCFTYDQNSKTHQLILLAKRGNNPMLINFVTSIVSPMGRKLKKTKCLEDIDIFRDAKLNSPELYGRLTKDQLRYLGLSLLPDNIS